MSTIKVTPKKGESFESLLRRFKHRERGSGKPLTARGKLFFERTPNKNKSKASALRKKKKAEKFAFLLRAGKIAQGDFKKMR
jgi:ribosomal protein S21